MKDGYSAYVTVKATARTDENGDVVAFDVAIDGEREGTVEPGGTVTITLPD